MLSRRKAWQLPAAVRRRRAVIAAIVCGDPRLLADVFKWGPHIVHDQFIKAHNIEWDKVPGWRGKDFLFEDDKALDRWIADENERKLRFPGFKWRHTPLSFACLLGRGRMVRALIQKFGAKPDQRVYDQFPESFCLPHNKCVHLCMRVLIMCVRGCADTPTPPKQASSTDPCLC